MVRRKDSHRRTIKSRNKVRKNVSLVWVKLNDLSIKKEYNSCHVMLRAFSHAELKEIMDISHRELTEVIFLLVLFSYLGFCNRSIKKVKLKPNDVKIRYLKIP